MVTSERGRGKRPQKSKGVKRGCKMQKSTVVKYSASGFSYNSHHSSEDFIIMTSDENPGEFLEISFYETNHKSECGCCDRVSRGRVSVVHQPSGKRGTFNPNCVFLAIASGDWSRIL